MPAFLSGKLRPSAEQNWLSLENHVSPTSFKSILAALVVLAIVIRLAAASYWHQTAANSGTLFRLGDSHSYWTLAEQLSSGQPYQYGSENAKIFRAPLYPLILVPFTLLENQERGVFAARGLGCVLGGLAVGLLGWLTARLAGTRAGIFAGALGCFYPSAIGMSVTILSEAVFMPLMLGHLICWQAAERGGGRSTYLAVASGGLAGLAILARPSWLLFLPFAIVISLLLRADRKRNIGLLTLAVLGLACVMSPWWIRNAWITGKFVPTTLQVGPSLYDGLHAGATGASDQGMDFVQDILARQLAEDAQQPTDLESTLEWRVNQRAVREATQWAREHPWAVADLGLRKFQRTWSLWPDGGELSSTGIRLAISLSCGCVTLLAICFTLMQAFARNRNNLQWIGVLWLPCLYFSLLHMVFVGSVRYREPALFVLIALAGCALDCLAGVLFQSSKRTTPDAPVRT